MKGPTPPGTPPKPEPPGGRAFGRARQFAQSRGLPAPRVLKANMPVEIPEPTPAAGTKNVSTRTINPRASGKKP